MYSSGFAVYTAGSYGLVMVAGNGCVMWFLLITLIPALFLNKDAEWKY